jgi:hypothetical protein
MLGACAKNRVKFRYVLNDVWYASSENMVHVKQNLEKEFVMPIKTNRKVALSSEHKKLGEYEQVASVELEPGTVVEVYVEQVEFSRCCWSSKSSRTRTERKESCIW